MKASNPSFTEATFSKSTDMASADLWFQAICGKSLTKAHIHFFQTAGVDEPGRVYLKYELEEPIVSSYSLSSGGERPTESVSLHFTKILKQFDDWSGDKVTTGTPKKWDVMANKAY